MYEIQNTYHVVGRKSESQDTVTLFLTLADGCVPVYNPGQFITVFFPEFNTPEGKAYSISSSPHEKYLAITVKQIGQFSGKLCSLQVGDMIAGSIPYGFFGAEYENTRLIMIAGGIGITPFRSILLSVLEKNSKQELYIFYSAKQKESLIFREELEQITKQHEHTHIHFFVTQEKIIDSENVISRRIGIDDVVPYIKINTEFLICGSISFTRDNWKMLKMYGVDEKTIYTEAFFK